MKTKHSPLMALALAGIVVPAAKAAVYTETEAGGGDPNFSNVYTIPTDLTAQFGGAFNPGSDTIYGTASDGLADYILLQGGAGLITIPFSVVGNSSGSLYITVWDNAGQVGELASTTITTDGGAGNGSLTFTIPLDGNYMWVVGEEGNDGSYTIGAAAVPEASTVLPLMGVLGLAVWMRSRKQLEPNP